MNRRKFSSALGAAIAGLSAGAALAADDKKSKPKTDTKKPVAKHDCAGKNDCKGQGGCASGDNGCAQNGVTGDPPAKSGGLSVPGDNLSQEIRNEHPLQMLAMFASH